MSSYDGRSTWEQGLLVFFTAMGFLAIATAVPFFMMAIWQANKVTQSHLAATGGVTAGIGVFFFFAAAFTAIITE